MGRPPPTLRPTLNCAVEQQGEFFFFQLAEILFGQFPPGNDVDLLPVVIYIVAFACIAALDTQEDPLDLNNADQCKVLHHTVKVLTVDSLTSNPVK